MTKATSADLPIGTLVNGRYRVAGIAGRGGLATVYRADDESLGRTVALKVISGSLGDADDARRHEDEVRLIAGFNHPGLVTLFDFVPLDEGPMAMLVMQYVDGTTLAARIARGPLSPELTAEIGVDVAAALAHVHERGVMHRDVKPANILLPAGGSTSGTPTALLADFGIARLVDEPGLTSTGMIVGTASYLSPEQAAGKPLGPPTDIYSLGLVLLEALTGTRAFPGSAVESVAARLASDPTISPELSVEWRELLSSMVQRDPAARPSAADLAAPLSALAGPGATGPTLVMQSSTQAMTERLEPLAPTAALPAAATPRPPRRPVPLVPVLVSIGVALGALVILAIVLRLPMGTAPSIPPASAAPSAPASETPATIEYPAVEGALGEKLAVLQDAVANLGSDTATETLQNRVLETSDLAASGDFEESRSSLDELQRGVDQAELSATERDQILAAMKDVRKELDELTHPKPGPGNGNKPGKG